MSKSLERGLREAAQAVSREVKFDIADEQKAVKELLTYAERVGPNPLPFAGFVSEVFDANRKEDLPPPLRDVIDRRYSLEDSPQDASLPADSFLPYDEISDKDERADKMHRQVSDAFKSFLDRLVGEYVNFRSTALSAMGNWRTSRGKMLAMVEEFRPLFDCVYKATQEVRREVAECSKEDASLQGQVAACNLAVDQLGAWKKRLDKLGDSLKRGCPPAANISLSSPPAASSSASGIRPQ